MSERTTEPADLWQRAGAGDSEAREQIAALARSIALNELRRRGVGANALEDLAQDVVRSTLAFLSKVQDPPRDLRGFLKYRAWGVLSDHRKHMRSAPAIIDASEAPDAATAERGPAERAHRRQLADALAQCKSRLSAEQREAVELRYGARLETETIAVRLAVHRNTINVRVFRALDKLRDCLARKGFDAGDLTGEGS